MSVNGPFFFLCVGESPKLSDFSWEELAHTRPPLLYYKLQEGVGRVCMLEVRWGGPYKMFSPLYWLEEQGGGGGKQTKKKNTHLSNRHCSSTPQQ